MNQPASLRQMINTALRDEIRFRTYGAGVPKKQAWRRAGPMRGALDRGTIPPTPTQFRASLMESYAAYAANQWPTGEMSTAAELALIEQGCAIYNRTLFAWAYGPSFGAEPSEWQLSFRGPKGGLADPDVQLPEPI